MTESTENRTDVYVISWSTNNYDFNIAIEWRNRNAIPATAIAYILYATGFVQRTNTFAGAWTMIARCEWQARQNGQISIEIHSEIIEKLIHVCVKGSSGPSWISTVNLRVNFLRTENASLFRCYRNLKK